VKVPALFSVTFIEPAGMREPDHPSPALPPVAEHASALFEFHVNEKLCPAVSFESLLDSVALGAAAFADVAGTAT
jgi:hypothetical protein